MMSNTIPSFPVSTGAALLSSLGHSCLWLMKKYAAAPLTTTAVIALTVGLGLAANNALFGQTDHHPAPLFFGAPAQSEPAQPAQVTPPANIAPRPVRVAPLAAIVPAPVDNAAPIAQAIVTGDAEVSNADLANAQRKLQSMGLFTGDVDGFYGPKTAEAIRAFEMRNGMTPKGDMSRPVINAILRADASDHATIDAARTTAHLAETQATPDATQAVPTSETQTLVSGQRALQALIAPQVDEITPVAAPSTSVVASVATPVATPAPQTAANPSTEVDLIKQVQSGLASLGFLHSRIDGVAGEETAYAIRNFEVFNNYEVTGRVTPELVNLLISAGAVI